MAPSKTTPEEPKQALPSGHPQAGYVSPDLSFQDGAGTLSDIEQQWHDDRDDAQAENAEAVADSEDKVAKEIAAAEEETPAPAPKTTAKAQTSTSGSSST